MSEDVGSVSVCAVLRGDSAGEVIRITLVTQDQTAQGSIIKANCPTYYHSFPTAERDYAHTTEINSVITGRLCMAIPIIDNYLPGSSHQFTVQLTSSTIPTATSTVIILDDGMLLKRPITVHSHLSLYTEIPNGCMYEVVNETMSEDVRREEVIVEIAEVLDSVLSTPLGGIVGEGTPPPSGTSDTPPLRAVYTAVADEFDVEATDEGFNNFTEAITQITEAKEAACKGNGSVSEADITRLAREYKELRGDIEENIDRIREIFGKMLCLSEKSREDRRKKRDSHCVTEFGRPCCCLEEEDDMVRPCCCPEPAVPGGPKTLLCVCEFFACLDPEDDIQPILGIADVFTDDGFACLAFAVDTTGSMSNEIRAVQDLLRDFLASEEDGPQCYVLQPFNDHLDGTYDPASKLLILS